MQNMIAAIKAALGFAHWRSHGKTTARPPESGLDPLIADTPPSFLDNSDDLVAL